MYLNLLKQVVIIDDDPLTSEMLADFVNQKYPGIAVNKYSTGEDAMKDLSDTASLVILDYHLDSVRPGAMNGLQVLQHLKDRCPGVPVVMHTSQDSPDTAANTVKYGAYDYVVKGANAFHRLEIVMNNILKNENLRKDLGTQKTMNYILIALLGALLIGAIVYKMLP